MMRNTWKLRSVEDPLIEDLKKTTLPLSTLGKKYGVSKQAVSIFSHRKKIKRPKRDHAKNCTTCQSLIRIARKPRSEFISSQTLKEGLGLEPQEWAFHIRILRKRGLIPQRFGRLHSKKAELAYQIYFKKELPVSTIERQVGLKNFRAILRYHRVLGWDVSDPLFAYDGNKRRKRLKMTKKKGKMQLRRAISPSQREPGDLFKIACVENDNYPEKVFGGQG